jgi:hypothetical protein
VGQILNRGGKLCGGAFIVSRYGATSSTHVILVVKRPQMPKI